MTADTINRSIDVFTEALWLRLRDIVMVQSRWDSFVNDPEGDRAEPSSPPEDNDRIALDMLIRSLRLAVDPVHHAILRRLGREEQVTLAALMEQTALSRTLLIETIQDLSQVGLASYAPETREVRITAGGAALLEILEEMRDRLARMLAERALQGARR